MRNVQIEARTTSRPKVIVASYEFFPRKAGISIYVQEMAKSLQERGFDVTVWAPFAPEIRERHFPYPVRTLPFKGTQGWISRIAFACYLIRDRQEIGRSILFLPEPGPIRAMMYLLLLPLFRPARLVVALHGTEIHSLSSFFHRRLLFRRLLERADRIGVVSDFTRRLLEDRFPTLQGRAVVTANALRTDLPREIPEPEQESNNKIILTVARVYPRKGQIYVLQAIRKLPAEERAKTVYWIVGPANTKRYLRRLVAYATKYELKIKVFGEVDDGALSRIYKQADIFAMTSVPYNRSVEGFGLSYLEASSFGLPVVGFRFGGVGEAVKDGETGLLCDQHDTNELARNLFKLLTDKGLRQKLGRSGELWARRNSWLENADALFNDL